MTFRDLKRKVGCHVEQFSADCRYTVGVICEAIWQKRTT
jgi:hypothetical protein